MDSKINRPVKDRPRTKRTDPPVRTSAAALLNTRTMYRGGLHLPAKTRAVAAFGKPLSAAVAKAARSVFKKYGTPRNELADIWPEIVGKTLADVTAPERYTPGTGLANNGVLTVRVAGAIALDLQHMSPQILERVNAYFGYNAVGHLKLVQGPVERKTRGRRRFGAGGPAAVHAEVPGIVQKVNDPKLRAALESFGREIAKSDRSR